MQTYRVRQPYAPNRCSAPSPSHLHLGPCRGQGRRRATDEGQQQQQQQRTVADYTSSAEAARAAVVAAAAAGGGAEPVEGRRWD